MNMSKAIENPSSGCGFVSGAFQKPKRTAWYLDIKAKSHRSNWGCRNANESWNSFNIAAKPYGAPYAMNRAFQSLLTKLVRY
jgi:hypothetical protein